jgi:MFS family permease
MAATPRQASSRQALLLGRWRLPFFYGWVIVAVVFIADFIAAGMGGITVGLFFKPMGEAFGWSLTMLTGAVTAQSIAGMIVSPVVGPALDRFGARPVMVVGALVAGAGLLLMTQITSIWQFWVLYALIGALGLNEMGQMTGTVVVSKWFVKKRGRAMAIATVGTVFGGAVFSPVIGFLLDEVGWRMTWGVLGVALLAIMMPVLLLFMRRQPEDLGLLPDGEAQAAAVGEAASGRGGTRSATAAAGEVSWTLKEALRTRSLWLLVLAMNLISLSASSVAVHIIPYLTQQEGMSLKVASFILSARLLGATLGRIPWGFIVERFPARYCLAMVCFGRGIAPLVLVVVPFPYNIPPFIFLSGFIGGNLGLLQPMTFANYYGRAFTGSIQGMLRPLLGASSLGGPLLIAILYDAQGTFDAAFAITGVLGVLAIVAVLMATPPRRG